MCQSCGRKFKNSIGLTSHLTQSDCGVNNVIFNDPDRNEQGMPDHTGSEPEQQTGQEHNHSSQSRYAISEERAKLDSIGKLSPIKWPKMNDDNSWKKLDRGIVKQLDESRSPFEIIKRIELVVYDEGVNLFGCKEEKSSQSVFKSRRERRVVMIRNQIKDINKKLKQTKDEDQVTSLLFLRDDLKVQRKVARRAENSRKRRWKRKKLREKFYQNPFQVGKEILAEKSRASLKVEKEVINAYVKEVASDPLREIDLGNLDGLPDVVPPSIAFNSKKFSFEEFQKIVKKARNKSRPGPNQIPYKVYKKCPLTCKVLLKAMNEIRKKCNVPIQWRVNDGIFIPKVEKPRENKIEDFRQIALLNVEGKLFWSLVANRLYKYLVEDNKYISIACQKGSIRGVAGCWEHSTMVWNAIKDARSNQKSLAILWLDLANAYGTVPHKLIEYALKRYGVPQQWSELILAYYDGLWGRSSAGNISSDWFRYEKGIFAGCTISVILFLAAFNVIMEYVEAGDLRRYNLGGVDIEVLRGFMDDLSVLTTSVLQGRIALKRTEEALNWCRMRLKPPKSRSLVVQHGVVQKVEPFCVGTEIIPGLHNKPLRTLGRNFDGSLTDCQPRLTIKENFHKKLLKIDKTQLTGFQKAWVMHFILFYQMKWDLMIFEVPISFVEALEIKQNVYARKWLGLPKCTTDVSLYSNNVPCPLPLKSLVTLFKETKVGSFLQLQYSKDDQVTSTLRAHKTGCKWSIGEAINRAELRIEENKILGNTRGGKLGDALGHSDAPQRLGLGFAGDKIVSDVEKSSKAFRMMITSMVQQEEEERHTLKAVNQALQGSWTKWQNFIRRDISWRCAFASHNPFNRFCVSSTYNTLPTRINLERWGLIESSRCPLCGDEHCSIRHILSGCNVSLHQGRYLYRHNQVLRVLAHHIQSFLNVKKVVSSGIKRIHFVGEGAKEKKGRKPDLGILHRARDFVLDVDLNKQLHFPPHIACNVSKRPDMVIYSNSLRMVVLIELTCPCEERFHEAHSGKMEKYGMFSEIYDKIKENGWDTVCFPVEIGARGYCSTSLRSCLRKLGLGKIRTRKTIKEAGDTALRSSYWIWLAREQLKWEGGTAFKGKAVANVNTDRKEKTPVDQCPELPQSVQDKERDNDVQQGIGVRGIVNCGNTCFINVVLQILGVIWDHIAIPCQVKLGNLLHEVIRQIRSDYKGSVYPMKLIAEIRKSLPGFHRPGAFEDAQEFLMVLLGNLGCLNIKGTIRSVLRYKCCQRVRNKKEVFRGLQLPIPELESSQEIGLGVCLDKYQEWEQLEKSMECTVCSKCSKVERQVLFTQLPKILIIHFVRFKQDGTKNSSFIRFPFKLLLRDAKYKLAGVVNHLGSSNSGHYTSFIEYENKWVLIDDEIVVCSKREDVISKDAYILIYELFSS